MTGDDHRFELLEASIAEALSALGDGTITSRWLTERYLHRIEVFDSGDDGLHSVVVLNPQALDEAAESDRRRSEKRPRPLEGIPFTVKDSYSVQGLTVAAGSPAFKDLVAGRDAFAVAALRAAGAVLIGKTNMPPMADGGMQRGLYGRAESPYNRDWLAAAFASGSSNGSGVATAANLAMFGMGEETVSSGRSPASNNGLCAYTPSWGLLSIRGNWPLFPTRDVVVPHTRSMPDMLRVLDVLVTDDPGTRGDFWRRQQVVDLPTPSEHRPESYLDLEEPSALEGKRLAVPRMYLGQDESLPLAVRESILRLWDQARARLEHLGAEVVITDFPLVEYYEGVGRDRRFRDGLGTIPADWSAMEFDDLLAFGWDDFLRANGDPALSRLSQVDHRLIFPHPAGTLPDRYERMDDDQDRFSAAVAKAHQGIADPVEHPSIGAGLRGVIELRAELFEAWMETHGYDAVVFPANADVGREDTERNEHSADRAWANGVLFSNGNYALRHLGIPTVTVPMGLMDDIGMPVGLTFAGAAHADLELLRFSTAFDLGGTPLRPCPSSTPALAEDVRRS